MSSVIDLSQVPAPDVIEEIDFEQQLAAVKTFIIQQYNAADEPDIEATLEIESEPLTKLAQAVTYICMGLRQRINEAGTANMLPYARGADLDNLATLFGVERLQITEADFTVRPPVPATFETDEDLRRRVQLSLEGLSVAGPAASYVYHALSADGQVLDASAYSPAPGEVRVTVLSRAGDGTASQALLDTVNADVSAESVRPLTDYVTVQGATIREYAIDATLYLYDGPDSSVVIANARAAVERYVADQHRLGRDVTLSGVYAALHQPGTQRVTLREPAADIVIDLDEAAYCPVGNISLTFGGVDE